MRLYCVPGCKNRKAVHRMEVFWTALEKWEKGYLNYFLSANHSYLFSRTSLQRYTRPACSSCHGSGVFFLTWWLASVGKVRAAVGGVIWNCHGSHVMAGHWKKVSWNRSWKFQWQLWQLGCIHNCLGCIRASLIIPEVFKATVALMKKVPWIVE
jgi:hypothetical protein